MNDLMSFLMKLLVASTIAAHRSSSWLSCCRDACDNDEDNYYDCLYNDTAKPSTTNIPGDYFGIPPTTMANECGNHDHDDDAPYHSG